MGTFTAILMALFSLFLVYRLYTMLKSNPELISKQNISKSFMTTGVLALGLIAFVGLLAVMLRA